MKICAKCNNQAKEFKKKTKNGPICRKCYYKYYYVKKLCILCQQNSIIFAHGMCRKCYKNIDICIECNKKKAIEAKSMCKACYIRNYRKTYTRPIRNCKQCNSETRNSKKELCGPCYRAATPKKECASCKENKHIQAKNMCNNCYSNSIIRKCKVCKKSKRINAYNMCIGCYGANKRKIDLKFGITERLRSAFRQAFNAYSNGKQYRSEKYGIDYAAIADHLGPCPGERKDYHIDHIFPLSAFNFNNPIHIKAAFAPENHQWLKKEENLKKSNKYNKKSFREYLDLWNG